MDSSTRNNSGEILTTALLLGALVAIVGSIIGAGSQILNSSAYAPVPRIERTEAGTTLRVIPNIADASSVSIIGNLCFGAGLGSGVEKANIWASDDPPGKHVISNVPQLVFNGGSGDYPAPCIKPDPSGDAILTNASATPNRQFTLTAKLSAPLTDKCVDVYLHLSSNRQGRWPNFRQFKMNKNGLCVPAPTGALTATPSPAVSQANTPTASLTPPISLSPTIRSSITPTPRVPSGGPSGGPSSFPSITPTGKPGSCGQSCSLTSKCSPGLTCITDECVPARAGCVRRGFCIDLGDPNSARCRPTITPTRTPTPTPRHCTDCVVLTPTPSPTPIACVQDAPGWLDNNRSRFISSVWAKKHQYVDCPSHNNGVWPTNVLDCFIPDQGSGPSAADSATVKDPSPLYYKHLTPIDSFDIITIGNVRTLQETQSVDDDAVKKVIRDTIVNAVKKDPKRFSDISFDSVSAGMSGGRDGEVIRSLSLWVHPVVETIITDAITVRERAQLLYQPYIEGAIGEKISTEDVTALYDAALNHCGSSAEGGVQSGLGVRKTFGDYTAVVQNWVPGGSSEDDIFSDFKDCNIHVVRTTQCIPSPTPTKAEPTKSAKPNISGKITVKTCVAPEVMFLNRCEKGGSRADCKDVVQEDVSVETDADDSIWYNKAASQATPNTYVYNYRITSDSQHLPIEEGGVYHVPFSLLKIGLHGYFSERELTPVTATGTRDFVINATENCVPTPTVQPTKPPRCIFNPKSFVKIRENGTDKLLTEAGSDATQWSTMNDKRISKFGDSVAFRTAFDKDGRHQPCGEAGCDLTGKKWCCVDNANTPNDSYDLEKDPDFANITLFYPKDKFKIVAKCDHTGKCVDVNENDPLANRVDKLPIGCGQIYDYGWVVERKAAASCKLTDKCEPTIKSVERDEEEETPASSVKINWDKPAIGCEYTGYTMEVVEPTGNGVVVCRAFTDASDKTTSCHLVHDEPASKVGAVTGHTWKRYITYTINLFATSDAAPDCRSKAGSWKFTRNSDIGVPGSTTAPEPTVGTDIKEYNSWALNLFDGDLFKGKDKEEQTELADTEYLEDVSDYLCWSAGNNESPESNVRIMDKDTFSCAGEVKRENGKVVQITAKYTNKSDRMAWLVWQNARCEGNEIGCHAPVTGPDGDLVAEARDQCGIPQGKAVTATWDVSKFKPAKPGEEIVHWENDLGDCLWKNEYEGHPELDPQGNRRRHLMSQPAAPQVIPPFPPSRRLAPQGVAPVGYAQGYPDYQKTEDGKLVLNGIYINDITDSPISTDSEGNLVIAQEPDYRISFLPKHDGQFLIDVLGSPFEEVRTKAEDDFVQLLGIDKPDACWLYTVESTTDTANPEQSGKNYMLSFCEYRLRADINDDNVINGIDYALLARTIIAGEYIEATDINQDGANDGLDTSILVDNFGRRTD